MFALLFPQSALEPAGIQAGRIDSLWKLLFWVCAAVFVLVIATLLVAISRRAATAHPDGERRRTRAVSFATAITVVILFVFLIASVSTSRALASLGSNKGVLISVMGHQWWWEVHYPNQIPSQEVATANEIHIPAGTPVMLKLTSQDVIHSFWVPNLHGKQDLIPGRVTSLWIRADKPGVYRGQCAEYCGMEHAHMGLLVIADPPDQFDKWMEEQRRPSVEPADAVTEHGRDVFLRAPCILCHTIRGIDSFGTVGPDLTHIASRQTIAAGTLPNSVGSLGGWITDSQGIKPGNAMPPLLLAPDDLQALLQYLKTLK